MTYRGERIRWRPWLGINPTVADHDIVHAWSVMGIGTRQICVKLGERLNLGKPMAMCTLYYHFRNDLVRTVRGRHKSMKTLRRSVENNIKKEMEKMIFEASARGRTKK